MKITLATKVDELLDKYPFLLNFLIAYNPKFIVLKNRAMRATMGRMATLSMVATVGGISVDTLINDIAGEIKRNSGEDVYPAFSQPSHIDPDKLTKLKELINDLHKGIEFREVKKRFNQLMTEIEPSEIAVMEEELIREGMPATEIQRLCDLHVSVFKEALEKHEEVTAPPGHPVHTYRQKTRFFPML